ncbi:MAG: polysulfide reductase NrfD [Desulfobulbaceae bacterium]|uniref:Polysulfide reductase NrfD n=1 Tax=Candidatus Desulfatifera sulfidica TaxID=2841691 RepID=A0A8J6TEC5_9BACT|nr:polysulfide reductase NrfD [Candidatus Desulfatifera sulfidica]
MNNTFSLTASAEPRVATPLVNKLMVVFGLMMVIGVGAAAWAQYVGHHHAFANTREMPWGMLIGVYAFFAIISTGLCLLAAISHIFGGNNLSPLANRMVWMSICTIMGAFFVIGLEIENPWRMPIGNVFFPNLTSNIWWMGTLYGMAVGFMLVEFYLILTKKYSAAITLGVMGAVAEASANSNLGSVFASLNAHPFWYGSQLPIFFLGCAFLCGASATIMFTHYAHIIRGKKMDENTFKGMQTAGKVMGLMLFLITIATFWKFANAYAGSEGMILAANSLVNGPLSINFWIFEMGIGLALPFALLMMSRLNSIQAMSTAALMVLVGQFFSRYDMVVAGLSVPHFPGYDNAATYLSYSPSAAEYALLIGGIGTVGLGFLLGERFFGQAFKSHGKH